MKKLLMMTALLLTLPAMADEWEEEAPTSPWKISGFTDAGVGGFLQDNPVEQQTSLLELRTQLSANRYFGSTFFSHKTQGVLCRLTGVNNQRFAALTRSANMGAEARTLPLQITF